MNGATGNADLGERCDQYDSPELLIKTPKETARFSGAEELGCGARMESTLTSAPQAHMFVL